jgi:hypothetical protein
VLDIKTLLQVNVSDPRIIFQGFLDRDVLLLCNSVNLWSNTIWSISRKPRGRPKFGSFSITNVDKSCCFKQFLVIVIARVAKANSNLRIVRPPESEPAKPKSNAKFIKTQDAKGTLFCWAAHRTVFGPWFQIECMFFFDDRC